MTDQPENPPELETAPGTGTQKITESSFNPSGFKAPEIEPAQNSRVIELDEEGEEVQPEKEAEPKKEPISFDGFYGAFKMAFAAPAKILNDEDFLPLAIQDDEDGEARNAAEITYNLLKQYVPDWLIDFDSKWMKAIGAGMFFLGKAKILALILQHKREMKAMEFEAEEKRRAGGGAGEGDTPPAETRDGVSWLKEKEEAA